MMKIDGNNPLNNMFVQSETVQNNNKSNNTGTSQERAQNTQNTLNLTDELKLAQSMGKELASQDPIDHKRVAQIKLQIQNKTLDILADKESADAASARIADKLLGIEKSESK